VSAGGSLSAGCADGILLHDEHMKSGFAAPMSAGGGEVIG